MRICTPYTLHTGRLNRPVDLAVVSDLHNEPYDDLWPLLEGADAVLVPGDISDRYRQEADRGLCFLREAARRMPVFFSVGNHETRQKQYPQLMHAIGQTGAQVLVNRFLRFGQMTLGGWYPPETVGVPDMLDDFEKQPGYKVLLCHKPNHYFEYLQGRNIDLVISGHAHGGQIRIGGQGLYAPDQGLFPRYTHGLIDGRMIVSAGAGNPARMPRWGNPCEVLRITLD